MYRLALQSAYDAERLPLVVVGPLAHVHHRAASRVQRPPQFRVAERQLLGQNEAAVRFHVVDAPLGERVRVHSLMAPRGGQPGARHRADVSVQPELEAARVRLRVYGNRRPLKTKVANEDWSSGQTRVQKHAAHVVGERLHAARETLRVASQLVRVGIAFGRLPAVVHRHYIVSGRLEPLAHHCINFKVGGFNSTRIFYFAT